MVGDEVEQRGVDVVPDGADDRGARGGDRPQHRLVAERQEVLDAATAAGDDDDVDLRVGVELGEGRGDLGHRVRALHGDLADLEAGGRPAAQGVLDDVALGGAGPPADEADPAGEEGQRLLAVAVEQALLGEVALEVLEAGEQLADADRPDLAGVEHEAAALGPERRLGLEDDAGPLAERAGHRVEGVDVDRHRQAHVDVGVAQGQVGGAGAGAAGQLDDLALDPQDRHLLDVLADLHRQQAHRPGLLGGGVDGALGQRRARRGAHGRNSRRGAPSGGRSAGRRGFGVAGRATYHGGHG